MPHLFDPFFTAKQVGTGTGLGMSMVYGSIQPHRGVIKVNSVPGQGTSIHLYLGLVDASDYLNLENNLTNHIPVLGFTVLLVDDNIQIRNTYSETLEHLVYEILSADNGLEALKCFEQHTDRINLVISDIVMPKMSGFQVVSNMRLKRPSLPVIFMTGYDQDNEIPMALRANSEILHKPFAITDMVDLIQQMIETGIP